MCSPCQQERLGKNITSWNSGNSLIMEVLYSKQSASSKSGSSTPSVSTVSWLHQKIYFPLSQVHRVGRNHLGWGLIGDVWRKRGNCLSQTQPTRHLLSLLPVNGKETPGPMLTRACCTLQLLSACWMPDHFTDSGST